MSITVEGQQVAEFLENVLELAAADPESYGLERSESNSDFTFGEVARVLNRGSSSDRVLDESDRDYFVSRGLMSSEEFLILANFLGSPSLRSRTLFSASPTLTREAASARRESRCEELGERLRGRSVAGIGGLLGLGLPLGPGNPFLLGTALMSNGAGGAGDLIEYVNGGCVD